MSLLKRKEYIALFIIYGILLSCNPRITREKTPSEGHQEILDRALSAPMPWLIQPSSLWQRNFSCSPNDSSIRIPGVEMDSMHLGIRERKYGLFDKWELREEIHGRRGTHYAEVTEECKGKIELNFALTPDAWKKTLNRVNYYRAVDRLIDAIVEQLLVDFGNPLSGTEKEFFLRAMKTLAWQESQWQHYLRYEDWFFVILSGGSYNKLDDWGITQVARSAFNPDKLLNQNFFEANGFCSISSSLYYGFMEYFFCYLQARENPENGPGLFNKIVGGYNRYCSGYSSAYAELSQDPAFRSYQIRAMGGFKDKFILQPWESHLNLFDETACQVDRGGIVRGDTTKRRIVLMFTGGDFHDGGEHIRNVLKQRGIKASFFFTGDFYRDPDKAALIHQLVGDGHYLGPHSDKHLLYCPWENRDSTLVSKDVFVSDMQANYNIMITYGIQREDAPYFIPPYEWYNASIAQWASEMDLILVNFTPGTDSNADYTIPSMSNYRSSQLIYDKILDYESTSPHGLNGFLLLLHIGTHPERTDKFYYRLKALLDILSDRGYSFIRIDEQ